MADKGGRNSPGQRTLAVHAGEGPDPHTGASAPNIVMSSTFVLDEPVGFSAYDIPEKAPYIYSRWSNPTVRQLEDKLATLEQAQACRCFASGMAATAAVLFSLLKSGDRLVISDANYPGTAELARNDLARMGIEVVAANFSDLDAIERAITPATRLVWGETPANPTMRLTDIAAVAAIAHQHGARLAIDSTFATPIATQPITLGADYVIHSLTKYCCGHGDAMGGAVLASEENIQAVATAGQIHFGGVISPFNAWLINRGLATLPIRMQAHQDNAMALARYLEAHPQVDRVFYPGLPSHPHHELACRQMDNFSGMLSFRVSDGPAMSRQMMAQLQVIHYAVSLGHHRSLICWLGTDDLMASSYHLSDEQLAAYREFAGDGVFRLSVGLEDPADLSADLARVLG
ncbi:MAG: PLP-dependent aspartate aminotransferase family protein [Arenicellales bacterium]|jgi:methionine-gamma-lyase|nr:PLP-dependent aspartate aminotransferase family protein [Arenicellales bacterium]|tara:strand:+ start:1217 stop:2425 length:1209 start_codon:yes stop_codon:yes gene_type:complete